MKKRTLTALSLAAASVLSIQSQKVYANAFKIESPVSCSTSLPFDTVEEEVIDIIAQYCSIEPWDINSRTYLLEDLGLDSLDILSIHSIIHFEFDLSLQRFPLEEMLKASTVGDVVLLVNNALS